MAGCTTTPVAEPNDEQWATYRITGTLQGSTIDLLVKYEVKQGVLTATIGPQSVATGEIDVDTGLVLNFDTVRLRPREGGFMVDYDSWYSLSAADGAPILGSFFASELRALLNVIPPPIWLIKDSHALHVGLKLSQTGNEIELLDPDPYALAYGIRLRESWTSDDALFPLFHNITNDSSEQAIVAHRQEKGNWAAFPSTQGGLPGAETVRKSWSGFPPLGSGEVGSQLSSFFQAMEEADQDLDFVNGHTLAWDITIWRYPTNVSGVSVPVDDLTASVNILHRGGGFMEKGTRQQVAGVETEWQLTRTSDTPFFPELQVPAAWPPLMTISEVYVAHNLTLDDHPAPRIRIQYPTLASAPGTSATVWWGACTGPKYEIVTISLWSGKEILRQRDPCI